MSQLSRLMGQTSMIIYNNKQAVIEATNERTTNDCTSTNWDLTYTP